MKFDSSMLAWIAGAFAIAVALHSGIGFLVTSAWALIRLALLIGAAYWARNWVISKWGNPIVGVGVGLAVFFLGWGLV